uniref:Uncharacterized protein n=1 Tax=Cacopsylla melanoneura TaxID=428564 RepID=A0A8D9FC28_9HEMI
MIRIAYDYLLTSDNVYTFNNISTTTNLEIKKHNMKTIFKSYSNLRSVQSPQCCINKNFLLCKPKTYSSEKLLIACLISRVVFGYWFQPQTKKITRLTHSNLDVLV